jgi:hypothetical protein
MLVAGGSTLLCLAIGWSKLFEAAHFAGVKGHIFRRVFLGYWAPFYGRGRTPDETWAGVAFLLCLALVVMVSWKNLRQGSTARFAWVLGGVQLAFALAIGGSDDFTRLFGSTHAHKTFMGYAAGFASPFELVRGWIDAMPGFTGFARHYPPGLSWASALLGATGAKLVFLVSPTLGLWAVHGIARELEFKADATRAALLVYATSAPLSIFPTLTPTPALLLPGALAVWLLLRGLRTGSVLASLAVGLLMAFFAFASFAVYLVALPMGCLAAGAILAGRCTIARAATVVGVSILVFAAVFLALFAFADFDLLANLVQADRLTGVAFIPNALAFALRVTGGFLAYAVTAGPLIVLAFAGLTRFRREPSSWVAVFCLSMISGFVLGGLSGRAYLETERIFMLYAPLLAIPAGWELARRAREEGSRALLTTATIGLGLALAYGLFIQHHFSAG